MDNSDILSYRTLANLHGIQKKVWQNPLPMMSHAPLSVGCHHVICLIFHYALMLLFVIFDCLVTDGNNRALRCFSIVSRLDFTNEY